jgi:hypothetical protein
MSTVAVFVTLLAGSSAVAFAIRVRISELMTVDAVGLHRFETPAVVHLDRDRLKMLRVHTRGHAAEVVDGQAGRYRAFGEFIAEPVSWAQLSVREELAIASVVLGSDPKPTRFGLVYLLPEPFKHSRRTPRSQAWALPFRAAFALNRSVAYPTRPPTPTRPVGALWSPGMALSAMRRVLSIPSHANILSQVWAPGALDDLIAGL